jgi:secondary thiamine-phosphate synthase enzyme
MTKFEVRTALAEETIDITDQVAAAAAGSGLAEGALLVWCPHTTAAIFVNEGHDPDVLHDIAMVLGRLVPGGLQYLHGEGNSPAHLKSLLGGCSVTIPVFDGRLALGTWQRVFFAEFDGPRVRQVWVQPLAGAVKGV